MSFRITPYLAGSQRFSGGHGNFGDARFSYSWAIDNARNLSEPVEVVNVGDEKIVPLDEIYTDRYQEIMQNKAYFNNVPPTPELDKDDPNQDMARIYNPIPKQLVKKGSLFLFGQQKFKGIDSFKFQSEALQEEWAKVWSDNAMDSRLIDLAQCYLRDGDVFYKVISKNNGQETIGEETKEDGSTRKIAKQLSGIKFVKTDAANWSAIVSIDNPDIIIAWVYQFEKADGKFVREEYFRDRTIYYDGQIIEGMDKQRKFDMKIFTRAMGQKLNQKVKFVVRAIEEHNLMRFPIIRFKNNEQSSFWGPSIYRGHYGQFDRLNEIYTQLGYAIKMMADPLLWVAGSEAADQNTKAADAIWSFENPQATLNVLQWPGIPDSVFKYIDLLESKIYDDAFVPRTNDLDKLFGSENRMSGKGIQELKSDVVDATMARRNDFEAGFQQMVDLVAILSGIKVTEATANVDLIWGPVFQSGSIEKRDALLTYLDKKVIDRETVIQLSDDFPPQMKDILIADLASIDQETIKMAESIKKAETPKPVAPVSRSARRNRKT